ncbi:hypothetical protein GZH47_13620 [Paenibacillus rhizovicinus]|uniref:Uncharacterized protein n=1 Tax=Paenibacillus rhizovicinus TaxID=2704463 RepID=A0A6C0NZW2_9BACL|nr:hypothetical protein [Paenibacillus rhizovicinus]QHW31775.1 hypothetical protein GZH47_13620 [Paenibacillus rhizovicinus]
MKGNNRNSLVFDADGILTARAGSFRIGDKHVLEAGSDRIDISNGGEVAFAVENDFGSLLLVSTRHAAAFEGTGQSGIRAGMNVRKISLRFLPRQTSELDKFSLTLDFMHGAAELWDEAKQRFHWIPNLKTKPRHVSGQHTFRSPAVIVTAGDYGAAVVPDLKEIRDCPQWHRYLDLRFGGDAGSEQEAPPRLEYGIQSIVPTEHTYYEPDGAAFRVEDDGIALSFYLMTFRGCTDTDILDAVASLLWNEQAAGYETRLLPQTVPFTQYAEYGNGMALQYLWRQGPDARSGGITLTTFRRKDGVMSGREYPDDLWFHAWFNNMRTAMELADFGTMMNRPEWIAKADEIARCLTAAPQQNGIFPTIYAPRTGEWAASSEHGGGKELYSLPDCAWSALWLRKYASEYGGGIDGAEVAVEAERFLESLRRFMYAHQDASGGFPCWVRKADLTPDARLNDSASGALAVWFLGEELLADALSEEEKSTAMQAVILGAEYLMRSVLPEQKFDDFELYYSCSSKPLTYYDPFTCMYGQNTLAIQWCAEAFRVAYLLTGTQAYKQSGLFCVHLLSLYQQAWDAPFMSFYTFGGFGVMNTDAEWNDARQAQFAETLANYHDLTGRFDMLKRAVAAARASFALMAIDENEQVCPNNYRGTSVQFEVHGASAENYGHGGTDARSHQSGFHWGTGSALVTAARLKKRYGDLYIDFEAKQAIGVDGIVVVKADFQANAVVLEIEKLAAVRDFEIRVRHGGGSAPSGSAPQDSSSGSGNQQLNIRIAGFEVQPLDQPGRYAVTPSIELELRA